MADRVSDLGVCLEVTSGRVVCLSELFGVKKSLGTQMEGPLVTELGIRKEAGDFFIVAFLGITVEGSGTSEHGTLVN